MLKKLPGYKKMPIAVISLFGKQYVSIKEKKEHREDEEEKISYMNSSIIPCYSFIYDFGSFNGPLVACLFGF